MARGAITATVPKFWIAMQVVIVICVIASIIIAAIKL
jgi:hypothetical protein